MAKQVEFFFDFVSPAAYLAWTQIPKFETRIGGEVRARPFFLGGVLQASGNKPPLSVPAKGKWFFDDMRRFAQRYDVPLKLCPQFPVNTLVAMRAACGLEGSTIFLPFCSAMYDATWGRGEDIGNAEVRARISTSLSLDPTHIEALGAAPENKERLRANSEEAVARGAFGAPTFFVGDEMFWGQDRLDFVAEAATA